MEAQPREIRRYIAPDGKIPFSEWYYSLRDPKARLKIEVREHFTFVMEQPGGLCLCSRAFRRQAVGVQN